MLLRAAQEPILTQILRDSLDRQEGRRGEPDVVDGGGKELPRVCSSQESVRRLCMAYVIRSVTLISGTYLFW